MKYVVSTTYHLIDETNLDTTCLMIVMAKNEKEAAKKAIINELIQFEYDFSLDRDDIWERPDNHLDTYGITKSEMYLDEVSFKAKREKYWSSKIKFTKNNTDYKFLFDDVDGISGGVFGIQVLELA